MKRSILAFLILCTVVTILSCHKSELEMPLDDGSYKSDDILKSLSANGCAFGADPQALQALTVGGTYTSASDTNFGIYATFLYDGSNSAPVSHQARGNAIGNGLQKLHASGNPSASGKYKAIAEGPSNAYRIFNRFAYLIANDDEINSSFVFVNNAENNCDLECWKNKPVGTIDPQVQIAFLYHTNNRPQVASGAPAPGNESPAFPDLNSKRFPGHAQTTLTHLRTRLLTLKQKYPNLKLVYFTGREYGGWSCSVSSPSYREPVGYEEGFAIKWFIDGQVDSTDAALITNGFPWLAWGPYSWNKTFPLNYFQADGVHLTTSSATLVAQAWIDWLKAEPSAQPWFL